MTEERRKNDGEILKKLEETNGHLIILDRGMGEIKLRQDIVIKRLDTINGTVADYNQRKHKIDEAHLKVATLEAQTLNTTKLLAETALINKNIMLQKDLETEKAYNEIYHKIEKCYLDVEEKFVSNKSLSTVLNTIKAIGVVLSLIVTAAAVLSILKSCGVALGG